MVQANLIDYRPDAVLAASGAASITVLLRRVAAQSACQRERC